MEYDFILASSSPRRLDLLVSVDVVPKLVISPDIDEFKSKKETPLSYVKRIAYEKAKKIATLHPNENVLAADTVVVCGNRVLIKTTYEEDARYNLNLLSGRRHKVITAICFIDKAGKKSLKYVSSWVKFKRLLPSEIDAYIQKGEWKDKAGSYAIQGFAGSFIRLIVGSYSNIVGLPLYEVMNLLKQVK